MTTPFWTVLIAILIPFFLALLNDLLRFRQFGVFDNNHPREQTAKLTGLGARVWAAQQNAWEALIMYIPSVLIAHIAGADPVQSTYAAIVFCIARISHSTFYLLDFSTLRSASYFVALACCLRFFWLAANA